MLVTLKQILKIAEDRKIAVGAFNCPNLEALEGILSAAKGNDLPVIIQFAQCHEELTSLSVIGPVMVEMAEKAPGPVCVHLDHGEDLEYLEKALKLGFTGIMYDGSVLPYEENVAGTRKAVELAARYGASVEAELGSMGRRESGHGDGSGNDDETKIYTDPAQAQKFVADTGIDALACSFGTTHGIYLTEPRLNFDVVRKVRELTGIPVVMHGGSGVSREDYREAVKAGVRKINYFTYMDKAGGSGAVEAIRKTEPGSPVFFSTLVTAARKAMAQDVGEAMKIFALEG